MLPAGCVEPSQAGEGGKGPSFVGCEHPWAEPPPGSWRRTKQSFEPASSPQNLVGPAAFSKLLESWSAAIHPHLGRCPLEKGWHPALWEDLKKEAAGSHPGGDAEHTGGSQGGVPGHRTAQLPAPALVRVLGSTGRGTGVLCILPSLLTAPNSRLSLFSLGCSSFINLLLGQLWGSNRFPESRSLS